MELNQVTFPVREMTAATAFYRRLGCLQIVDTPHYARFECPGGSTSFSLARDESEDRNGAIICFEHEALDQLVEKLQGKGFEFDQLPTDMRYLWREAVLHDPSGNKIKLYWAGENRLNPPWRVDRRD